MCIHQAATSVGLPIALQSADLVLTPAAAARTDVTSLPRPSEFEMTTIANELWCYTDEFSSRGLLLEQ